MSRNWFFWIEDYREEDVLKIETLVKNCIDSEEKGGGVMSGGIEAKVNFLQYGKSGNATEEDSRVYGFIQFSEQFFLWTVKNLVGWNADTVGLGTSEFEDLKQELYMHNDKVFDRELFSEFFKTVGEIMRMENQIPLNDIRYYGFDVLRVHHEEYFDKYVAEKKEIYDATRMYEVIRGCPTAHAFEELRKIKPERGGK